MKCFNKFYRFGSEIKPKAALYSWGIIFFIALANLYKGNSLISILTLVETFMVAFLVALVEYFAFKNYEVVSIGIRKRNTIIWALLTNVIIIGFSIIFSWFPDLTIFIKIILLLVLQCGIVAMRYSIYVVNMVDSKELNSALENFQSKNNVNMKRD